MKRAGEALETGGAHAEQALRHENVVSQSLESKPYLTAVEAAMYLSLPSVNALKLRMRRGTVPAWCWTRMGGRSIRFIRAELDRWLRESGREDALRLVHSAKSAARTV